MRLKRTTPAQWMAVVTVLGFCTALAGLFLLAGLAITLLAGGVIAAAFGLLVDV